MVNNWIRVKYLLYTIERALLALKRSKCGVHLYEEENRLACRHYQCVDPLVFQLFKDGIRRLIDGATSDLLISSNWAINMQVVDEVNRCTNRVIIDEASGTTANPCQY